MGQYLNWVTGLGIVLIVSGIGLLALAVGGARGLAPARHRRPRLLRQDRWREAGAAAWQPQILRSALLADTVTLKQVVPAQASGGPGDPVGSGAAASSSMTACAAPRTPI